MAEYPSPVDKLLTFGDARDTGLTWPDYLALGFGPEHIPDLIRMATDPDLNLGDVDGFEIWAPIHAWRTLGQLRAEAAVTPLLGLLKLRNAGIDYDDWTGEELPDVFALIGPAAIPALKTYMSEHGHNYDDYPGIAATGLENIAERYPEARDESIAALTNQLAKFETNAPEFNGFIIADLIHLKAVAAAETVKAAFFARRVDLTIAGNWNMVKDALGLDPSAEVPGPEPADEPIPNIFEKMGLPPLPDFSKSAGPIMPRLPNRVDKAKKAKRKQEKKSRKLNRKRK